MKSPVNSARNCFAFCFHDPEPTGASQWLHKYLLSEQSIDGKHLAIFPAKSPLEDALKKDYFIDHVHVKFGDLSNSSKRDTIPVAWNRIDLIRQYLKAFRKFHITKVYVNSSYQIAPIIAARLLSLPVIVHVHEAWNTGVTSKVKQFVVRELCREAIFAARKGIRLFGPPTPTSHWYFSPNGVPEDLCKLREKRAATRKKLGLHEDEFVYLFLGMLSKRKGFPDLMRAWPSVYKNNPAARLLVAGGIDKFEKDPVISRVGEAEIDGMSYLGYRNDAHDLIAAADLLVLPSYGEAMPISISEAMMIGTPVLARAVGDIPWQIGGKRGYLFKRSGHLDLLKKMIQIAGDSRGRCLRASRAQEFARLKLVDHHQYRQITAILKSS